jgi:hypothetical protein
MFMPLRMATSVPLGIKEKAESIFATLFPNIQCQEPYIESEVILVPFTWNTWSKGLMVFSESGLDAFRCRPFQFENSGTVDWIKMKYLTKESAIIKMEAFLRPLMSIIYEPKDAEQRRPRT